MVNNLISNDNRAAEDVCIAYWLLQKSFNPQSFIMDIRWGRLLASENSDAGRYLKARYLFVSAIRWSGVKVRKMLMYFFGLLGLALVGLIAFWLYATNVETPEYKVARKDGSIEIRDYPALVAAETTQGGSRYDAVRTGFSPLAGYIFAKERPGDKIAMTAPVAQIADESGWRVQFFMPSGSTLESLPKPAENSVKLAEIPERRLAAIQFSGVADDALLAEKESALRAWLQANGLEGGPAIFAYYNDPFTPGFLRRNEVLVQLKVE